jgi:hypothetical protein
LGEFDEVYFVENHLVVSAFRSLILIGGNSMSFIRKTIQQKRKWAKQIWSQLKQAVSLSLVFMVTGGALFFLSSLWFLSKFQPISPIILKNVIDSQILLSPTSRIDMQIAPTETLTICHGSSDCSHIVMEIQRIDSVEHKIYGVFRLKIPHTTIGGLSDWDNNDIVDYVIDQFGYTKLVFRNPESAKKNLYFRVNYNLYGYSKNFFITVPISLGEILSSINEDPYYRYYEATIPFDIEAIGDPGLYPNDRYLIDLTAWFFTPDGVNYGKPDKYSIESRIPFDIGVSLSPNMAGKVAKVYARGANLVVDNYKYIGFEIYRDQSSQTYIYGMSVIPILLTLLLFHRLFFNKRLRGKPEDNLLLEVAAVFLAILPLRSVLVPPEIETTTRVDYILAFSVTLLVSILLVRYSIDLMNHKEN